MQGVSIIICCYNSAKRLPDTLAYIAKQEVTNDLNWEVVLVNNNSSDNTSAVAEQVWEFHGAPVTLKVVDELKPGLSSAREKGMQSATYDVFLWCDDDNWLCDIYVQTAIEIMEDNHNIGALGGWCHAAFETEKPLWFNDQARFFAVSKQGKRTGDITHKKGCVYGAGMVLRKSHWLELKRLGFKPLLSDRIGTTLSSGGDTEYCYALRLIGYKIWYDERLYFNHFMAKERMHLQYVRRIRKAMTYSNFILWPYLDMLNGQQQTRNDFLKRAFNGFPKIHIKKLGALIIGGFEKKAVAKRYLTHFWYRLLKYELYRKNYKSIQTWFLEVATHNLKKEMDI